MPELPNTKAKKLNRDELGPHEVLCEYCTAKCCRYFALPIDTPEGKGDLEFIRWYLLHNGATVFTEDDTWYLLVHSKCKHLGDDQLCGIYETRPQICRDYTTENCEYDDDWVYEHYWETPEQIAEYTEAVTPTKRGESIRSPRPPLLPMLSNA